MSFIQIIDLETARYDDLMAFEAEWRAATEGKRTLRRSIVAQDRNKPGHYYVLAFFDDYESAMANSDLPETGAFAAKQAGIVDAPPSFIDLDVLVDKN